MSKINEFRQRLDQITDALISGEYKMAEENLVISEQLQKTKSETLDLEFLWIYYFININEIETASRRVKNVLKKYKLKAKSVEWVNAIILQSALGVSLGHYNASEKELKKALKVYDTEDAERAWMLLNLGCILRDRGEWNTALEIFETVQKIPDASPEMITRAAVCCLEMLSDLGITDVFQYTDRVKINAPKWAGWQYLKIAQIVHALNRFRIGFYGESLAELYRNLMESDQLRFVVPRIRARLALAEALVTIGDWEVAKEYLLESKAILETSSDVLSKYYYPIHELLWLTMMSHSEDRETLWEALDRLEIILAVVAKYSRPPGTAPFWLLIADLHARLNADDSAKKAYRRAQAEAAKTGVNRYEAMALLNQGEFEWSRLSDEKKTHSGERNRILAITSKALDIAELGMDRELEWQNHYFRGQLFLFTNESYPATGELSAAAACVSRILACIEDAGLRRTYASHPTRRNKFEELQEYLKVEEGKTMSAPKSGGVKIDTSYESAEALKGSLQPVLNILLDIYSAKSLNSLIPIFLQNILQILDADGVSLQLEENMNSELSFYSQNRVQNHDKVETGIPSDCLNLARQSNRPFILQKDSDEDGISKQSVLVSPLKNNLGNFGIVYITRDLKRGNFQKSDAEILETIIQAAAVSISTLKIQERLTKLTEQFRKEMVPEFPNIIGESQVMKDVFILIQKVAVADVPVLISGETGTGKDLVARTIHEISNRKKAPYVYLDCSAIPLTLLEAELFGIEKGIATGVEPRMGLLEYANGGTILLDEVGGIPLSIQAKLLRVLQEREFEPVGSDRTVSVDLRIISTTSKNLEDVINDNKMREDFYYRLSGVIIDLPPLRKRHCDIMLLAHRFLTRYNEEFHKDIKGFTENARELLTMYSWPGNVRELDHVIRKSILFSRNSLIDTGDLFLPDKISDDLNLEKAIHELKRRAVAEVMKATGNNSDRAAQLLKIDLTDLKRISAGSRS